LISLQKFEILSLEKIQTLTLFSKHYQNLFFNASLSLSDSNTHSVLMATNEVLSKKSSGSCTLEDLLIPLGRQISLCMSFSLSLSS